MGVVGKFMDFACWNQRPEMPTRGPENAPQVVLRTSQPVHARKKGRSRKKRSDANLYLIPKVIHPKVPLHPSGPPGQLCYVRNIPSPPEYQLTRELRRNERVRTVCKDGPWWAVERVNKPGIFFRVHVMLLDVIPWKDLKDCPFGADPKRQVTNRHSPLP